MRQKRGGIRAFDDDLIHMVALIKQNRRLTPGDLFVAPVLELWGHHGVDIHPGFGIAQHRDWISSGCDCGCQTLRHKAPPCLHVYIKRQDCAKIKRGMLFDHVALTEMYT